MSALDESDRAFLHAIAEGETAVAYARRHNYSDDWAKFKSRRVRGKLGAATLREAVAMADDDTGVSRADFEKLTGLVTRLGDSLEELARRPNDQGQQQQVRERELDLKDHAKALGLTVEDVERLKGEKEYRRFKEMQERLDQERAEADDNDDDGDGGGNGAGRGIGDRILDGLGGITNRAGQ